MNAISQMLIIVTPVYEDIEASTRLFRDLKNLFDQDVYIIAVDDGSVVHPLHFANLKESGIDGVILKLCRNVGHQKAIAIGQYFVASGVYTLFSGSCN